jgi:signal transduction histidine kinase
MMDRQVGHLVSLVDDLLDVSRVSRGKVTLRPEPLDLRTVVEAAVEAARPAADCQGHDLVVRLPGGPLPVTADRVRLVQVVTNLLHNACKYTPGGGRIEVTAGRDGPAVVVRVADTGEGIPPDMLPKVFDLFTQVDRDHDRTQGGLGIGLALVRKLVELHGGEVFAQSPGVGLGTTVTVRLPADPVT